MDSHLTTDQKVGGSSPFEDDFSYKREETFLTKEIETEIIRENLNKY